MLMFFLDFSAPEHEEFFLTLFSYFEKVKGGV
jgi:hypothetical protein